jgi:hypothetical protein
MEDEMSEKKEMEKLPEYITLLPDGNMQIETRQGTFIIEEPDGDKFDQVERIAVGTKMTDFKKTVVLIARCMIEPKIGETELLKNYKISTLQRLAIGMQIFVDETKAFLMTPAMPSREPNGKESNSRSVFGFGKRLTS